MIFGLYYLLTEACHVYGTVTNKMRHNCQLILGNECRKNVPLRVICSFLACELGRDQ